MSENPPDLVELVFREKLLDAEWYRRTYPDVAALGMKPDHHYRHYGHRMGRAPNAQLAAEPMRLTAMGEPAPKRNAELLGAHEI